MVELATTIVVALLFFAIVALISTYAMAWLILRFVAERDLHSWLEDYAEEKKNPKVPK